MEKDRSSKAYNQDWQDILDTAASKVKENSARDRELYEMLADFQRMTNSDSARQRRQSASAHAAEPRRTEPRTTRKPRTAAPKSGKKVPKGQQARKNLFLFLWLSLLYTSILVRATTISGAFFKQGLYLSVFFSVTPALLVFIITTFTKNRKVNRGIVIGYSALVFGLYVSQFVYYKVFAQYYTAVSMGNAKQGFGFMGTIITTVASNIVVILLLMLPLLFVIFLGKRFFTFKGVPNVMRTAVLVVLLVVFHIFTVLWLPIWGGTKPMSPYEMYRHTYDVVQSAEKLGLGTAFRLDMKWAIFGGPKSDSLDLDLDVPDESEDPSDTQEPQDTEAPGETTPAPTEPAYNVLDIDFDTLIASGADSDVRDLHAYFDSVSPTKKNDHTGMFEGCNLIQFTCEGFYYLAIDPELTPTLYKMQTEGMNFTNFYTPIWGVSTSDGEYVHLTGTIPKAGVWSFYRTGEQKNYMPLTMCAQLKNLGYCAYAYHNNQFDYYDRDLSHPNMGYIYKGMGNGLETMGVTKTWPESDLEMIEATTEEYIHQQPFHAYYMTVSGHLGYTFEGNAMSRKNRELVADLPYSDNVKAYLATQIELDRALEELLKRLDEAGVAENTVIVMTADHYPYGLTNDEISELLGHEVEDNFEKYRNACIIYKKGMTPETIDWACSSLDVLPTLSNLFGVDFDSRLYMGHDVFSNASPLIIFQTRSWITDKCFYNYYTGKVTPINGAEITDDYISRINKIVANKFTVSAKILELDYWRELFKPGQ